MSVATAVPRWETPTPLPRHPRPEPTRKRHLHAVPAATGIPAQLDATTRRRVTRRGRLLLTTTATVFLLASGVVGARGVSGGGPAPTFDTVTVRSGQTLSQVAHHAYPTMSVANAVQRVQAANNLNTNLVFGGELLRLPR